MEDQKDSNLRAKVVAAAVSGGSFFGSADGDIGSYNALVDLRTLSDARYSWIGSLASKPSTAV
jgi:hypothetical protein